MEVTIVQDQGTHLLITDGSRYAVIERRNDQFYNCHGVSREGVRVHDLSDVGSILDDADWLDKARAQTTFDQIVERGNQLAQGLR